MATLVGLDLCLHLVQGAVYFLVDPLNLVLGDLLMPLLLPVAHLHVAQLVFQDLMVVHLALGQCIQEHQEVGDPVVDLDILHLGLMDPPRVDLALVDPQDGLVTDLVHSIPNSHPILHGDQGVDRQASLVLNIDLR